jgi:hypothetical protein
MPLVRVLYKILQDMREPSAHMPHYAVHQKVLKPPRGTLPKAFNRHVLQLPASWLSRSAFNLLD